VSLGRQAFLNNGRAGIYGPPPKALRASEDLIFTNLKKALFAKFSIRSKQISFHLKHDILATAVTKELKLVFS
jgi:hypothetical protein